LQPPEEVDEDDPLPVPDEALPDEPLPDELLDVLDVEELALVPPVLLELAEAFLRSSSPRSCRRCLWSRLNSSRQWSNQSCCRCWWSTAGLCRSRTYFLPGGKRAAYA